jgi:putative transcriptional regulator
LAYFLNGVIEADTVIKGGARPFKMIEFAPPEVRAIRAKVGLTQTKFASLIGVSKRTLENWEQGRRSPTGPARALLKILEADPKYALATLKS